MQHAIVYAGKKWEGKKPANWCKCVMYIILGS